MTDKTGGAAFPHEDKTQANFAIPIPEVFYQPYQMSLRDWFAGQALAQAVLDYGEPSGHPVTGQRKDRGNPVLPYASKGVGTREEIIARQAYRYADALLSARDEG